MKINLLIIALACAACGSKETIVESPNPTATPMPQVTATPSPQISLNTGLVGNWIDAKGNTLALGRDGTALSNTQSLSWTATSALITFTIDVLEVDRCDWSILTSGGLNIPLKTTLDLACSKSGQLTFSKQ